MTGTTGGPGPVDGTPAVAGAEAVTSDILDTAEAGRRVVTGGALRLVGYAVGLIASLGAAAVMFRYLDKPDYAAFGTVSALTTGIQLVADLGITILGVREYAQRTGEDRERFMRVLLGMRLVTTVLMIGASAVLSVAFGYSDEMIIGAIFMGIAISLSAIAGTVGIPLQAEIRMGVLTAIDVGRQLATSVAFIALCLAGAGLVPFLAIQAPIYLVLLFVMYGYTRGKVPLRPIFDPAEWVRLLKPTLVFALASAVGAIYVHGAMVLTELVATDTETANFAAAFRVFIIAATFPALLASTAFPLLSRAARDDRNRLSYAGQRLFEGSALLGGAALVGLVLGADVVMDILGGEKYRDAVPALRIQGAALALTFLISSFGFTLLALHRHRAIIVANACAFTVSATSVLLLGRSHGAEGASVGVLLGELTLATGYVIWLGIGSENLRPQAGLAIRVVPPLLAALACWFLPLPPLGVVVCGVLVYAAGVLLLRAIPDELLALIPGRRSDDADGGGDGPPSTPTGVTA